MFEELAQSNGWTTSKRGWPDFLCMKPDTGEIIAVEVKPRVNDGSRMVLLKREQAACLDALQSHGIKCFVSDGVTLEPYSRDKHASAKQRRASAIARRERAAKLK